MLKRILLIIYAIVFVVSSVFAGTTDPSVDDSKYIEYGNKFEHIGKIHGTSPLDNVFFYGSCVGIKDNIVITAAHIVSDIDGPKVDINNQTINIKKIVIHPLFKQQGKECDIALCSLEKPLGLAWYPKLYQNNNEVGKVCSMAGYGITGKFNSSHRIADQKKRGGSNIIDIVENNILVCNANRLGRTELEFLISYGDSGGGLFIGNELAGIHSSIAQLLIDSTVQNDYNTLSFHVRISKHLNWINNTITMIDNGELQ
jgi:hypothetical protein